MPLVALDLFRAFWALRRDRGFVALGLLVVTLLLGATAFYVRIEHLSVVDAAYLSVITLTTVGYGDVAPATIAGKIFTSVFVLVGMGILVAFVTTLATNIRRNSVLHRPLARIAAHRERPAVSLRAADSSEPAAFGDYDLLVIGSDEASRRAAIDAAGSGLRVVLVDAAHAAGLDRRLAA